MNIALDMMGGDYAPEEAVKGVRDFLSDIKSPVFLLLIGDEARLSPLVAQYNLPAASFKIVHAAQVIEMNEHPLKAPEQQVADRPA